MEIDSIYGSTNKTVVIISFPVKKKQSKRDIIAIYYLSNNSIA